MFQKFFIYAFYECFKVVFADLAGHRITRMKVLLNREKFGPAAVLICYYNLSHNVTDVFLFICYTLNESLKYIEG